MVLGIDMDLFGSLEKQATLEPITIVVALLFAAAAIPAARGHSHGAEICGRRATAGLVVGSGMMARYLLRYLSWDQRITIVGCVDDDPAPGTSVLGGIDHLARLCEEHAVDQVIVGFSRHPPQDARSCSCSCCRPGGISIVPRAISSC